MSRVKGAGLLKKLAESFAARLKERSRNLHENEALGLKLPGRDQAQPLKKVDIRIKGTETLELMVTWLDGSVETLIYGPNEFTPTLHRIDMTPKAPAPEPVPAPNFNNQAVFQQLIGQVSAQAALETIALARSAEKTGKPAEWLAEHKRQSQAVLASARFQVPGLSEERIKQACQTALDQQFGSIRTG